jgi:hypothetical protein
MEQLVTLVAVAPVHVGQYGAALFGHVPVVQAQSGAFPLHR